MAGKKGSTSKAKAPAAAIADKAVAPAEQSAASAPLPLPPQEQDQEQEQAQAQPQEQASTQEPLSAADRENPEKLTGEALRVLAHRRGVARSEADAMSDEKLRMQLRYITNRQYTEED